ncbi:MAG: hypothetical protein GY705_25190, partial [Bacteroidetes bacterium]|nr:hypothetical protein [Bacteroidota bacterium]
ILVDNFKAYLKGYNPILLAEVLDIVQNGVNIPSAKVASSTDPIPANQSSTAEFSDKVDEMLMKELKEGRIAGPFMSPPPGLIISPLGAVPKKEKNKIRIIHNLSHPKKDSVNYQIPRHYCAVEYELIDVCCAIVFSLGVGCLMSKGDLCQAFRLLRVSLNDLKFLGFTWKGLIYFDKMMPMGASISCAQFEKFAGAIQWILKNVFAIQNMSHILDDFLFFGKAESRECELGLQAFLSLCKSLGLEVKPEKTVWPSTRVELHGILFDSLEMSLSLPADKVEKALALIDALFKKRKVQLVLIQQIHGFLNFACRAVPPGRTFLRRISNLMIGKSNKKHFVRITQEARKDLQAWKFFLQHFNSTPILPEVKWSVNIKWKLFSDASGKGYAAVFGHKWIGGVFPDSWNDKSIAIKELTPIYLAFVLWIKYFKNEKICFLVDNMSVVHILRSKTSKDLILMSMVRKMVVLSMLNNVCFSAVHIPGRHNVVADLLSRFSFQKVRKVAPWLDQEATKFPEEWLPWSKLQQKWR